MKKHAIVIKPSRSIYKGLTTVRLGLPDYNLAVEQHNNYVKVLQNLGIDVQVMESNEDYPDSTFVEDIALITEKGAIILRPGAVSRQGEVKKVEEYLVQKFEIAGKIEAKGTVEGGDVLRIGNKFIIGISSRTNREGAEQLKVILNNLGYDTSFIEIKEGLHLKSNISYLGKNIILVSGWLKYAPEFSSYNKIVLRDDEGYAANTFVAGGYVLMPKNAEHSIGVVRHAKFLVKAIDISEFRKVDGGLSCLSLRY
ncbi:MAG: arginine deiminase family protein [Bacteroidales bacterium]|jgi:dimethylargininase|nr:arginine deiminase family protein [Bacteroidales bacterium]